jgi:hypothetical protein
MSPCGYRTRVLLLPRTICSTLREVQNGTTRLRGDTEMKIFHLPIVIGMVLAETKAAQGQTEDAQVQTEVDVRFRRARFGISILGT